MLEPSWLPHSKSLTMDQVDGMATNPCSAMEFSLPMARNGLKLAPCSGPVLPKVTSVMLTCLSVIFQALLKVLPAETGVAVDLQELFKRLSMDLITDMLFGSSTSTLTQTESDERGLMNFSHACELF